MEELFGRVKQGFWTITGLNFKWKHEHKQWRRGKQSEENSCSLPLNFWSTFRSPFSTCYIPFQSLGSQESNTSNRVRFGAEMRKIWPSEDKCIMPNDQFRKVAKISQGDFLHGAKFCHFAPWRNTLRKFRKEDLGTLRNSFESPVLRRCWCYSTAGSPRYFAWLLAL